jgi:Tol biopolymer transport system component
MIGPSFGPYSILGPLGAGGMGEVYRARDPRLRREVAIKIIGAGAAGDPERQARFEREARAASALNHPNILTVHDVGREGDTAYIVCELVEGEPLRESMRHGPLPVKELLACAAQVADGLAAAHEAGIVHRDLKPENVMVTRGGLVKILDFGLAKIVEPESAIAEARTVSEPWTRTGTVQGTAPYMSPEQASGKAVDFRSDQFSFGVMLYEMAAGRRPFDRATGAQTLAAIIAEDPAPLADANPKVPTPLRWVIERCLAKKPGDRYAATADLHRDLRTLRDRLPEATTAGTPVVQVPAPPPRRRLVWIAGALALVALAAVGGLLLSRREPKPYDIAKFQFTPFATETDIESFPEWSPDGRSLAYTRQVLGVDQIFVQGLASPVGTQITSLPGGCTLPFWASDGSRVFCIARQVPDQPTLYSVGAAGGQPALVLEDVRQASISPDGKTLVLVREKQRDRVWISSPPGAEPKELFGAAEEPGAYAALRFAPDGRKVGLRKRDSNGKHAIWIVDIPAGTGRKVRDIPSDTGRQISWLPDSRRIVGGGAGSFRGGYLWILDTLDGSLSPLTVGLAGSHADASVSPDGSKVAFAAIGSDMDLVDIPLDGSPPRALLATSRQEGPPSWNPAGRHLVYVTDREGPRGIWLYSPAEGTSRPLVTARDFDPPIKLFDSPSFSPDGQRVAYQAVSESGDLWISSVAGGPPVRLAKGGADSPTWSPDGHWIAYLRADPIQARLLKVEVGPPAEPVELAELASGWQHPQWSPRGDWISCVTEEGLTLVSPDGRQKRLLLAGKGLHPQGWSRDGATIYGLFDDARHHTLLAAIDVASARLTTLGDLGPHATYYGFSLSPGGKSFATALVRDTSDIWILDGLTPAGGKAGSPAP